MTFYTQILTQKVGSSETICKTPPFHQDISCPQYTQVYTQPFQFQKLLDFLPQHLKPQNYSPKFLSWFIGFTEGDGSFIVSDDRLFFTITQKDAALLYNLRTQLGFGSVCNDTEHPEIKRYTVTDRSQIEILIHLFNGNLVLKKTTLRFSKWVDTYNRLTQKNLQVISRWNESFELPLNTNFTNSRIKLPLATIEDLRTHSVIWNSSWLTGFIEAEGSFSAVQRQKHKTDREETTEMRFLLEQTNELEILSHGRDLLGDVGCIWIKKRSPGKLHYRLDVSTRKALDLLIRYLTKYPLKSKKNVVYTRWKKLLNYVSLLKESKRVGNFVESGKRQARIDRLVKQTKKDSLEHRRVKKLQKEVEERVQFLLKNKKNA